MRRALTVLLAMAMLISAHASLLTTQAQSGSPSSLFGVNLAGAEFGSALPGTHGKDYIYPSASQLDYYKSKNLTIIRLPFRWERLQHRLNGPLDTSELARIDVIVAAANERGMRVILDVHNYGRYNGQIIGSSAVPHAAFADFWRKVSAHYKDKAGVWAYGLMNEPHDMQGHWPAAAQAGVDGVRASDSGKVILVSGDHWSGAWRWGYDNADLWVKDPSNNVMYEAHQYFDRNGSGTYAQSYDGEGAYPTIGVDRAKPFIDWLKQRGARGFIGEFGVPNNDERWLTVLDNFMAYLAANGVGGTYWAGGPWWGDYPLTVEPKNGVDRPQMATLAKHASGHTTAPVSQPPASTPVVESPAPPVVEKPAVVVLYDNAFRNGFVDGTFNFRARNACDKRQYASPNCSYSISFKAHGGINFMAPGNSFNTSGYSRLEWFVRRGSAPLSSLSALVTGVDGKVIRQVRLTSAHVTEQRSGGWVKVSIPVSQLNPHNVNIGTVQLKNATGGSLPTIHIDDVRFVR